MSEENKALARRSWEVVTEGSLDTLEDALAEVYANDFILHEAGQDIVGIEGLTQFVSMMRSALPDLRITLEDDMAEGDKVVTRWIGQGTHQGELMGIAPTGNQVTITGITIHRIEDTKIVEEWSNWDALGLMQQIGAVPSP
jgi:steroid delta-isomerase-like uncharacterized protein